MKIKTALALATLPLMFALAAPTTVAAPGDNQGATVQSTSGKDDKATAMKKRMMAKKLGQTGEKK